MIWYHCNPSQVKGRHTNYDALVGGRQNTIVNVILAQRK